ncbi:MAG: phenylalanine--tRNA ligase beta subunit-related protein [bacterium]|nr:phenylalanine--tRNA ligase beta subunit-related protein [bacterium]
MTLKIDAMTLEKWPGFMAGFLVAKDVEVLPAGEESQRLLANWAGKVKEKYKNIEELARYPHTLAYNHFAEEMGLLPKDLFLADQQIKRCLLDKPLRSINSVVDAYFKYELWHNLSIGAHNIDEIRGFYGFEPATSGEKYEIIGSEKWLVRENELIAKDEEGVIYSFSGGDTERTKIVPGRHNILIRIDAAPGIEKESVESCLKDIAKELGQGEFEWGEIFILDTENREISF